ncbi:hypothetical protein COV03_01575 [Candidatus Uhrbacteria bacterium CG10_big_fil_rev_8_21_14_0_10_41_26]|nr:MAG: hypothetical protein COZ45_03880 [Candidatus Uhrbacteria bacterium CG_4_10_14_3_um_filter_41_21]PIZ54923.1 MAG: hypothetical protein COY24_02120 [Candidatus Uhrbacteria bacterium CG_4_10_14_0_2_um_filter_41_21]PJB84592.1 MAG: hypothetical protein CO086_02690 [Candidatus Uhrbacteria bacterium CG_4_9_14_0_8_um_filter_41_16]PJE75149.1 MAG: hypothetical protein COV03_01575 [Candidatus Uhrbacteria bacterium CG10_big_fil_rev_8_21_14_0_10_41_26]
MEKEDNNLRELQKITRELKAIKKKLETDNVPFWKMSRNAFLVGVIKGVGLVIGTTIVAAAVIYIIQLFVDFTPLADLI